MLCSLCNGATQNFNFVKEREYVHCLNCKAILLNPKFYLSPQAEKFRYRLHNNDVNDKAYIKFVYPITQQIQKDFKPESSGLDFGCGTGPVIASELQKKAYSVELYDPYFRPKHQLLERKYDFIICCEVMEHFHRPHDEFKLLNSMLKTGGKLYCKTELWSRQIDFEHWHYKNDNTHVIFYSQESLKWISANLNFQPVEIKKDFLVFRK